METPSGLIRPSALLPGDTIGIFTPSTPAYAKYPQKYEHGLAQLRALGFQVVEGPLTQSRKSQGYRSGSPRERAEEFMTLVRNPQIRCVISSLGGTATASLIPHLNFHEIRENPKIICGFSDLTALQLAILKYSGLSTFYGPALLRSFGEWPKPLPETVHSFLDAVQNHRVGSRELLPPTRWSAMKGCWEDDHWQEARPFETQTGWNVLLPGEVSAPAIIVNLNTLLRAAGTDYWPNLDGKILVAEEMNAPFSKVERNLRQLERMGVLEKIAGMIISKPEQIDPEGASFSYEDLISEIVGDALSQSKNVPLVTRFDCGHTQPMLTLAQMTQLRILAEKSGKIRLWIDAPMVR